MKEENHNDEPFLKNFQFLSLAIQKGLLSIRKIRPLSRESGVISRPYLEIIVDPKIENKLYLGLYQKYIIALRNYQKKFFHDNFASLKYIPLDRELNYPIGFKVDPLSVKVFKQYGEYGIPLHLIQKQTGFALDRLSSFYDTTEGRELVNAEKFPGKTSIMIFASNSFQTVKDILNDLETIFTPPKIPSISITGGKGKVINRKKSSRMIKKK